MYHKIMMIVSKTYKAEQAALAEREAQYKEEIAAQRTKEFMLEVYGTTSDTF